MKSTKSGKGLPPCFRCGRQPCRCKDGITLYCGPCESILPAFHARSLHLLLTDPPYGAGYKASTTDGFRNRLHKILSRTCANDSPDYDLAAALSLATRCLMNHRHLYIFGSSLPEGLKVDGKIQLVWDRRQLGAGKTDLPWAKSCEFLWFAVRFHDRGERYPNRNGKGAARLRRRNVLRFCARGNHYRYHCMQKPVPLLRELIESSSRIGETILDPFAGSGSTLVAAKLEGRRAIGIEIEEGYCKIAAARLDATIIGREVPVPIGRDGLPIEKRTTKTRKHERARP